MSRLSIFATFAFVLAACSPANEEAEAPTVESTEVVRAFLATDAPLAPYELGLPYEVNGVRYIPVEDFSYNKTGLASYYSSALNGAKTASGETYNSALMTAAHKTLPFQNGVRVAIRERAVLPSLASMIVGRSGSSISLSEQAARDGHD